MDKRLLSPNIAAQVQMIFFLSIKHLLNFTYNAVIIENSKFSLERVYSS